MSVIKKFCNGLSAISPKALGLAMGTCALLLGGCGSGTDADQNKQLYKQALATFKRDNQEPAQVTREQIAQVAASTTQPLILVNVEKNKTSALILEIGRNGAVQTFATSARQTISLQNGLARGTRGLGGDLMSVDLGQLPQLIARTSSGQTNREMRFLNGEDVTVRYAFSCSVTSTRVSSHPANYNVIESCSQTNGKVTFTNSYDVTRHGKVTASRQWFGPTQEYITLQHIRL